MHRSILHLLVGCAVLSLPARAQTVLFSDGFENGLANWGATGLWHIEADSDTCGSLVAPFPEGSHCAYYGIPGACNYDTGHTNSGVLTLLVPIALPAGGSAASLHCRTRHQTESCAPGNIYDVFDVELSANGGASWSFLGRRCDLDLEADDVWSPRGMDLTPWLGQSILLRFVFDTFDEYNNDYRGAFVDEVEVRLEAGSPFCTSTCPCAGPFNDASIGYGGMSGCTSSQSRQAELAGGGIPSVAADTVVLTASQLVTRSVAMFLQSDGHNSGVFDGDGRFCLTGTLRRLAVRPTPLGAVSFPGPGDLPLSVAGAIPAAGATAHYQVIYRDPTSWCTSAGFNHTNGYSVTWTP